MEGEASLVVAFDLADEGGDLNFNLLACAFKIASISCQMLYEDLMAFLSSSTVLIW